MQSCSTCLGLGPGSGLGLDAELPYLGVLGVAGVAGEVGEEEGEAAPARLGEAMIVTGECARP